MLVDERPASLGVALGADRILICRGFQVLLTERAMDIVAVAALHQPFLNFVMERLRECRLHIAVACEAQARLRRRPQQIHRCSGVVNAMAARAAHTRLAVR